ncbi:MAG: hypothetical protein E2O51_01490 [Gammaproteobacteria bacterium]|nr:MAG: hypothetical protein E2O51_01490 [Gammaproteobacteria bacterium]
MKSKTVILVSLSLGALIVTVPASAHHSVAAFANGKTLTLNGTVTEWYWANPHCLLKFDVQTDSGVVVQWVAETQAPANMIDAGWRKNDLKPGDEITVTVRQANNGNLVGRILRVELADGRTLDATQDRTGATGNEYHLSGAPTD